MNINDILSKIKSHMTATNVQNIKHLFITNPNRIEEFSVEAEDWLFDYSKTPIDTTILNYLLKIVELAKIEKIRDAMLLGEKINNTENRAVLHMALRAPIKNNDLQDEAQEIQVTLQKMKFFCDEVEKSGYIGATGKTITDIVNIGIGGSDLGPHMVVKALSPYNSKMNCHFVSNIDSADIADTLKTLNAETTLFIVTSKTFTTVETIENATYAKLWLKNSLGDQKINRHFVAITSAIDKAINFGIKEKNCFIFGEYIGGRYSLWGAVGLPIMLAIGVNNFEQLLNGARAMDKHFLECEAKQNIAILFGLINYYYRSCCGYNNIAVIPYEQRLSLLPNYLQQLLMESNGKAVNKLDQFINTPTSPIIWGGVGTNAQHAFFQYLHQGSEITPVEFIAFATGFETCEQAKKQRVILLANCLAQSEALLEGKEFIQNNRYKHCFGNRPSITMLFDELSPYRLGQILALYEHRTFVEGVLYNINSFDQWGVELGKILAKDIYNNKISKYNVKLINFINKYKY